MKKRIFLLLVLLLPVFGVQARRAPKPNKRQIAEQAANLINSNDFYALSRLPQDQYEVLPPLLRHLTDAVVGSHFNDLSRSCKAIEILLNEHSAELDGPTQNWLFGMLLGNLRILGEYGQAAAIASVLRQSSADDESNATLDGMIRWFGALAEYPKTSVSRPEGDLNLPLYVATEQIRNALGEPAEIRTLYTDVEIGGRTERFIFDTGCSNASFVSEEFAEKHGIRVICDSILVGGAAVDAYASAGVLDSMRVGPAMVYNPTFLITPAIEAVDTLYKIDAVLGTDFMNLVGEFQLYPKEGRIFIPAEQTHLPDTGRNLSLDTQSGNYILHMECEGEPVTMFFDTGSVYTNMGERWFENHRERVLREGRKKEIGIGGFGGTSRGYGYIMPALHFSLGTAACTMPEIGVHSHVESALPPYIDGWLGNSFVLNFDKITVNFDKMFVTAQQAEPADR